MKDRDKTREQLVAENEELRGRVAALQAKSCHNVEAQFLPISGILGVNMDITDRVRVEEAARESEERFRTIFEEGPIGVVLVGLDSRIQRVNRRFCEMLGYSEDEIIALGITGITHPDDREIEEQSRLRLLREEIPSFTIEKRYVRKDGQVIWGQLTASLMHVAGCGPAAMIGLIEDITDRKRVEKALQKAHDELEQRVEERTAELKSANEQLHRVLEERRRTEEALRQSERRFRNYFEQGLVGMATTSLDGLWLDVNDRLCQILGYPKEELLQTTWKELTYPEDLATDLDQFTSLLAGRIEHYTLDKRFVRKDSRLVYTTIHIRAFRNEDGTIDHIVALMEDITERKQAQEALRQSHDELQAIYDGMVDGLHILNLATMKPVRANAALCRMMGYSAEEVLSLSPTHVHPPVELPRITETFQANLDGRNSGASDVPMVRKDGSVFYADITTSRIVFNQTSCLMCFFRDTTERKNAQEALERERQSLWRMLQASDHERQTISYEIHDGLTQYLAAAGMQFQSHDALKQSSPNEAKKAYETAVELVRQAHFEARRLISEVRPPVIDEIGLETAISHLVHEQRRHGGPKIECLSNVQFGRLPPILENALYRIVQEALTNACKHSQSTKVTVTMTQEDQDVRLEVRDWGIGFDPESVEKGRFGLEGIRQRVRLLGGRLTIESTPGSGTLLQVVVPILEQQDDA